MSLFLEQTLNGFEFGILLFLLASGLTLVFGIMGLINLAHSSLYMTGAFLFAIVMHTTSSFPLAVVAALGGAIVAGAVLEVAILRRLYARNHLDQVIATLGIIFFFNELVVILWGRAPLNVDIPAWLGGSVHLGGDLRYPVFRIFVILLGLSVAALLYLLISKTRVGMLIRAAATNREMVRALGVDAKSLFLWIFVLGAALAGLAGIVAAPIVSVQSGMGEQILVMAFVVIVVGGLGSIRGAFAGALLVGIVDTYVRAFAPLALRLVLTPADADAIGGGLSSIGAYLVMAVVLLWRPTGLFPAYA